MTHWLQRRLMDPLTALLRQGISPDRLALCVAIGVVVGNNPILGTSTLLCALIALALRLNLPTMQLVQAAMAPTQVLLILPFVRLGEALSGRAHLPFSIEGARALAGRDAPGALAALWDAMVHAGFAWLLVAPFATWLIYRVLAPVFRRVALEIAVRRPGTSRV